jgi:hypothetical protein
MYGSVTSLLRSGMAQWPTMIENIRRGEFGLGKFDPTSSCGAQRAMFG